MGWTFAIPTDGVTHRQYHQEIFDSIRSQGIPEYEIILAKEKPEPLYPNQPDIREIYVEPQKPMWITRKKNVCTQAARFPLVCYMHDYIKLDPGWHEGYQRFGTHWDVCMNPVLILDSTGDRRFLDWMLSGPGWNPLDYCIQGKTNEMYVSGAYWCAKREFMMRHPLNENLIWGENEDGEWSARVRDTWNLRFNTLSVVRTLKNK